MFLDRTQRCTTVVMTPLDEWSARGRDLYLTMLNTHTHPCLPGGIRTHNVTRRAAADRVATATGQFIRLYSTNFQDGNWLTNFWMDLIVAWLVQYYRSIWKERLRRTKIPAVWIILPYVTSDILITRIQENKFNQLLTSSSSWVIACWNWITSPNIYQ